MNTREQTDDTNRKPVPADEYDTRALRPASRENGKPDGDRDIPPPRSCRTVMVSFREADFAARPPCYR